MDPFERESAPSLIALEPTIEEAWTVPMLSGERSSCGIEATGSEPVPVIQEELPPVFKSVTIILKELPLPPTAGSPVPIVEDVN